MMTKLEELINELCPDGVEYKKIGDVCDILRGKRLTKKELSDEGKYPVLHGGSSQWDIIMNTIEKRIQLLL